MIIPNCCLVGCENNSQTKNPEFAFHLGCYRDIIKTLGNFFSGNIKDDGEFSSFSVSCYNCKKDFPITDSNVNGYFWNGWDDRIFCHIKQMNCPDCETSLIISHGQTRFPRNRSSVKKIENSVVSTFYTPRFCNVIRRETGQPCGKGILNPSNHRERFCDDCKSGRIVYVKCDGCHYHRHVSSLRNPCMNRDCRKSFS